MYGDSSYGSLNGAIADTHSAIKEEGNQKLQRRSGRLFHLQLLALASLVTVFAVMVLIISLLK